VLVIITVINHTICRLLLSLLDIIISKYDNTAMELNIVNGNFLLIRQSLLILGTVNIIPIRNDTILYNIYVIKFQLHQPIQHYKQIISPVEH